MAAKIVITGGEGFIGTNLRKRLDKYVIFNYDIKNGKDIFDDHFEDVVREADAVIHLAALTSVSKSFKNPLETTYVNVFGTAKVAQLCAKYNKKLVYPSSAAVYFPDLSPYAKSKQVAEEVVMALNKHTAILRFYNVFGPDMNPDSGSIMYNFLTAKKLVVYGDGEQTRDFIHVRDVAAVIEDALKDKYNGKIVDVGTGQSYSVNYVAGLFSYFRGLPIEYQPPAREIKWSIANTDMLKSLYKKPLTTNLQRDIAELCKKI